MFLMVLFMVVFSIVNDRGSNGEIQFVHMLQKLLTELDQLNVGLYIDALLVDELQQADVTLPEIIG